jgi:hypothetical protein
MVTDEEIKTILENHEKRISELEKFLPKDQTILSNKRLSIKEFVLSKNPKNDTDKTLIICYFLEKNKCIIPFNIRDIESGYRNAKEPLPKNLGDKVQMNIKKGFLMLAKNKKDDLLAWELTSSGEKYVENGFKK